MYGLSQYPDTKDYIIVFQDIYCKKCGAKYTNIVKEWCELCQINYFKKNCASSLSSIITSSSFYSLNEKIDSLIKEIQSKINYNSQIVFEWIPYDQLNDIQEIGKDDDFDTMLYSATWKDGSLHYNDGEWTRKPNKMVTLRYFYDSRNIINLLNKVLIL
jgi:hypothetical protein